MERFGGYVGEWTGPRPAVVSRRKLGNYVNIAAVVWLVKRVNYDHEKLKRKNREKKHRECCCLIRHLINCMKKSEMPSPWEDSQERKKPHQRHLPETAS